MLQRMMDDDDNFNRITFKLGAICLFGKRGLFHGAPSAFCEMPSSIMQIAK